MVVGVEIVSPMYRGRAIQSEGGKSRIKEVLDSVRAKKSEPDP